VSICGGIFSFCKFNSFDLIAVARTGTRTNIFGVLKYVLNGNGFDSFDG